MKFLEYIADMGTDHPNDKTNKRMNYIIYLI